MVIKLIRQKGCINLHICLVKKASLIYPWFLQILFVSSEGLVSHWSSSITYVYNNVWYNTVIDQIHFIRTYFPYYYTKFTEFQRGKQQQKQRVNNKK